MSKADAVSHGEVKEPVCKSFMVPDCFILSVLGVLYANNDIHHPYIEVTDINLRQECLYRKHGSMKKLRIENKFDSFCSWGSGKCVEQACGR